jgi:hypothetical protein
MAIQIERGNIPNGAQKLLHNKELSGSAYTPPDFYHYPHGYLWDSGFHAIVYARSGIPELAQEELEAVFSWQDKETGFIANAKFHPTKGTKHPERRYVFGKNAETSKYSQPPVLALASWETYEAFIKQGKYKEAKSFLNQNYDSLSSFFNFFINTRENQNSSLVKIAHPHETGRDFDPTYDFTDPFIMKKVNVPVLKTFVDKANMATNQATRFLWGLNWAKRHNFDAEKLDVNDVMFNAIYANGLSYMAQIAEATLHHDDAVFYNQKAEQVGRDITTQLWDDKDKVFYAQRHGVPIRKISISNLSGIMVPEISEEQFERVLELIEDPKHFGTSYPIPSVPVSSPYFDPDFKELGLWRGGTWMFSNFILEKALRERAEEFKATNPALSARAETDAYIIRRTSSEMVDKNGEAEFFHPLTGAAQRKEVTLFGPSTLAHVM